jgi:uncharacterized glyoxalase superfamily protein PhnB
MLQPILACEDVDRAISFYTERLGFERTFTMPGDDGKTSFAGVRLGDAEILLGVVEGFVAPEDIGKRGIGVQIHVEVPPEISIDTLYERAKSGGATITREIETREWGERSFNVRDADGYNLMLAQAAPKSESG